MWGWARLADVGALDRGPVPLSEADAAAVRDLLDRFLEFALPGLTTAERLAAALAGRTRLLRDVVLERLEQEHRAGNGELLGFYEAFRKYLLGALTEAEFADLYAQTLTYGLFAARTRFRDGFDRRRAFDAIPQGLGVPWPTCPSRWNGSWTTSPRCSPTPTRPASLPSTAGGGRAPIPSSIFTRPLWPATTRRSGSAAASTTRPSRWSHTSSGPSTACLADGLASREVTLLDPAAGTMTFVARAVELAVRTAVENYGSGVREAFIREHVLRNFYAFELSAISSWASSWRSWDTACGRGSGSPST